MSSSRYVLRQFPQFPHSSACGSALRRREVFPLTDEGRAAAAQYLKDAYDAEPERWNNCPDMMDCDPWEPPAEPDTANE